MTAYQKNPPPPKFINQYIQQIWASMVAHVIKNLPEIQETRVQSLGQEDPLEKGMVTHSSISCLENSMDRKAWWATVHGVAKSWTRLSNLHFYTVNKFRKLVGHRVSIQKPTGFHIPAICNWRTKFKNIRNISYLEINTKHL